MNPRASAKDLQGIMVAAVALAALAAPAESAPNSQRSAKDVSFEAAWQAGRQLDITARRMDLQGCWIVPVDFCSRTPQEWDEKVAGSLGALCMMPPPPAPPIDWTQKGVIFVAKGDLLYGDIEIREVRRYGRRLLIDVNALPGTPSCGFCDYHVAEVDRQELSAVSSVEVRYDCPLCGQHDPGMTTASAMRSANTTMTPAGTVRTATATLPPTWGAIKARYR